MNKFIEKAMMIVLDSYGDPRHSYEQLIEANPTAIANDIVPMWEKFEYDTVDDILDMVENLSKDFENMYNEGYNNGQSDAHSLFQDEINYRG